MWSKPFLVDFQYHGYLGNNPSNHKFTALYPQQSTHPQFYLQSSNGHHATGNVWRESVLLVTESPVNPQTASEAKMDAPIHTATVKDGDKGFYITLHSCLKPAQKHTIRPEWTDPLFPSWHYCYMRFIEETWTSPYFQLTLKWTMVGSKNPESTKKKNSFFISSLLFINKKYTSVELYFSLLYWTALCNGNW